MKASEFYQTLAVDKSSIEALSFNPYYLRWGGLHHGQPRIGSDLYFDLASNDYLGLASDPRVQEAMIAAIREYGASMCGTPIASGYARILADLESELASFTGLEGALVFPSCYQANLALFSSIATLQDVIIVDHYAHASLGYGIKAAGCKVRPFLHNDMEHLERQLAASTSSRQIFVVTESVFSTEGSIAPLGVVVELCRRYNAIPIVDDSHGIGVLGKSGRGILEEKAIADYPGIYTASLGKALGNLGGVIAGKHSLIEALRYSCPGLIYSTALAPACVGGVLCALEIIRNEFDRLGAALRRNHQLLLETLRHGGFDLCSGPAPIAAIHGGSTEKTLALAKQFFDHRILTTPFVPPSVPEGKGTLRLIVGVKLDQSGIDSLMETLHNLVRAQRRPTSVARASSPAGSRGVPPRGVFAAGETPSSLAGEDALATPCIQTHRTTYLFIANPHARNGRAAKKLIQLRSELDRRGVQYSLSICETLDHARVLSEQANRSGADVIVGVGGDGTLNRVLSGFFDPAGRRLSHARMGAIHIGTSPDFCQSYNVPTSLPAAVDALLAGKSRPVRVGRIVYNSIESTAAPPSATTAFFGCCANIGLGASLARLANGGIRKYAGDLLGTFICLLRVLRRYQAQNVQLELDGVRQSLDKVYNIAIGKTAYIASGIKVRHELQEQDDRLYVLSLQNLSWIRLAHVLAAIYKEKPISSSPCLSLTYARTVRLSTPGSPVEVEFDGDPAGQSPCLIETAPDPLDLIVAAAP